MNLRLPTYTKHGEMKHTVSLSDIDQKIEHTLASSVEAGTGKSKKLIVTVDIEKLDVLYEVFISEKPKYATNRLKGAIRYYNETD
jgi:hypothetical protein